MRSVVLDTNCVLSFLKNRNPHQFEIMGRMFQQISALEIEGIIVGHVFSELAFVMENVYRASRGEIHAILRSLLDNPGVRFVEGYHSDDVLDLWPAKVRDVGDAVIAASAKNLGVGVMTFDMAFARSLKKVGIPVELLK